MVVHVMVRLDDAKRRHPNINLVEMRRHSIVLSPIQETYEQTIAQKRFLCDYMHVHVRTCRQVPNIDVRVL